MDIVYALGQGSIWNNNEIKYSLRSVQKHLTGFRDVYIIGILPEFLQGVKFIPFDDIQQNKESNIYKKILRACEEQSISDDFLFINDDHFLLQDFEIDKFPYYCKGTMEGLLLRNKRGGYFRHVARTCRAMREKNKPTFYFDSHMPIVYNKQKFINITSQYDWSGKVAYVIKSLYCNSLEISPVMERDYKINKLCLAQELQQLITSAKVFSIGNLAINEQLRIVLDQLYPEASRWEKK